MRANGRIGSRLQTNDQDVDGRSPVGLSRKALVLTFIYTRCPFLNFLSVDVSRISRLLLSKSGWQGISEQVSTPLQQSTDPEFDRPEVLKGICGTLRAGPKDWSFATGDADSIQLCRQLMGLYFEKQNGPHLPRSAHCPDRTGPTVKTRLEKQRLDPFTKSSAACVKP